MKGYQKGRASKPSGKFHRARPRARRRGRRTESFVTHKRQSRAQWGRGDVGDDAILASATCSIEFGIPPSSTIRCVLTRHLVVACVRAADY